MGSSTPTDDAPTTVTQHDDVVLTMVAVFRMARGSGMARGPG